MAVGRLWLRAFWYALFSFIIIIFLTSLWAEYFIEPDNGNIATAISYFVMTFLLLRRIYSKNLYSIIGAALHPLVIYCFITAYDYIIRATPLVASSMSYWASLVIFFGLEIIFFYINLRIAKRAHHETAKN